MKDPKIDCGLECDDGGDSAPRRQDRKGADTEPLDHCPVRLRSTFPNGVSPLHRRGSPFEGVASVHQHRHIKNPSLRVVRKAPSDAPLVTLRRPSIQKTRKSLNRRFIASVILPMKATIRCRPRIARRFNQPRCATSGLPLLSRSSSTLSDGNMVAHPAGRLFHLANDTAELSSRKMPPICPLTSRATQKPSM